MLTVNMNSPGPFGRWTRSISRTFGIKRRGMQNRGYYLIPLYESSMQMRSLELLKSCNIVQCGYQKRFFVLRPESWGGCKKELKYLSDALKYCGIGASKGRIRDRPRSFCTTAPGRQVPAVAFHRSNLYK